MALIGVGNLGNALLNYGFHQGNNIRISAAFDVKEDLVGRIVEGIPVYPMSDMVEQIKQQQIEIAIMTVPSSAAQDVANQLIEAGVRGIMNFTPVRLTTPKHVQVQSVNLTHELQTLIYFLNHYGEDQSTTN